MPWSPHRCFAIRSSGSATMIVLLDPETPQTHRLCTCCPIYARSCAKQCYNDSTVYAQIYTCHGMLCKVSQFQSVFLFVWWLARPGCLSRLACFKTSEMPFWGLNRRIQKRSVAGIQKISTVPQDKNASKLG